MKTLSIIGSLLVFPAVFAVGLVVSGLSAAPSVPCAIDGSPCEIRKDCAFNCKRCAKDDKCCCKHRDSCSCIDPTSGKACCE